MKPPLLQRVLSQKGLTITDTIVVVVIMGILAIPMSKFFVGNMKTVTTETMKVSSQEDIRKAMDQIERDFFALNQVDRILQSTGPGNGYSLIQFRMDLNQSPSYNPAGDTDGDGRTNISEFDDDNDGGSLSPNTALVPPQLQWEIGDDLHDDDDNNDRRIDTICQYSVNARRELVRQCAFDFFNNVTPPVTFVAANPSTVLATKVSSFTVTCFGAVRETAGNNIDLGNDGAPATSDLGERDGIVTEREMDRVQVANGGVGNVNNVVDGQELNYIYSIRITLAQDKNGDGRPDFRLTTEIAPPFLPLKRRL